MYELTRSRIGAGTGIFTRALLASPDWSDSVKAIKALEPSEGMRNTFSDSTKDQRVTIAYGTFNETGVEDGWADIIIIAQVRPIHKHSACLRTGTQVYLWPSAGIPLVSRLQQCFCRICSRAQAWWPGGFRLEPRGPRPDPMGCPVARPH